MGTLFSPGSIVGDSSINGPNVDSYIAGGYDPSLDPTIGTPVDNSQYSDAGQDPTASGGFLSSLPLVINDAFKAFQISQTPTAYRAASPNSPAGIAARTQAQTAQTQSTLITVGAIVVIIVVLYLLFRK